MGKKKKRKDENIKKFEYSEELWGVILVLLAILGIGKLGFVGKITSAFSLFLVGTGYNILLLLIAFLGGYLIIKKSFPKLFSTKLLGIYILVIGLLVLIHKEYVYQNDGSVVTIFKETINNLLVAFQNTMNNVSVGITGGGIIGCLFAIVFNKLFDYNGTLIVTYVLIGLGITMFTGFSIIGLLKKGVSKGKSLFTNKKVSNVIINDNVTSNEDDELENAIDKKIVISNISELNKVQDLNSVNKMVNEQHQDVVRNSNYHLPPMNLLEILKKKSSSLDQAKIEKTINTLEQVLKDFGIIAKVVELHAGPTVTQYELEVHAGTKVSKIVSLNREISLVLAKRDVRIEAPIPGKSTVGIEIPNDVITPVTFREVLEKVPTVIENNRPLMVPLGKNIMGEMVPCEINKTPHLLVAGATGSGKSVCINTIIATILMRTKPDEVKLVLVDPKKVELSGYNGVPHLMAPVVTDPKKASVALAKIVREMESRYEIFEQKGTKNIATYNELIDKQNRTRSEDEQIKRMPYIVVVIDELADLMLVAAKEVEDSILRITQMARAAGIHLIIATQRPSTDIITGIIKANIPSRISFAVSSSIDSRTILDMTGAEKLLGKGDMLFFPMGESMPQRLQGAFISDDEIKKIIEYTVAQQKAEYDEKLLNLNVTNSDDEHSSMDKDVKEEYEEPLYDEIVEYVIRTGKASASLLQRKYRLGYNRAARIIDLLEERGIIGPVNGSKPREVLVKLENSPEINDEEE